MDEWNPFEIDEFSWDLLKVYMKHGYGAYRLYHTSAFSASLNDETAMLTIQEFYDRAVDYNGQLWSTKTDDAQVKLSVKLSKIQEIADCFTENELGADTARLLYQIQQIVHE